MPEYMFNTVITLEVSIDVFAENEEQANKRGEEQARDMLRLEYLGGIVDNFDFDRQRTYSTEIEEE